MSNQPQLEEYTNMIIAPFKVTAHEHSLLFCFPLERREHSDGWTCNGCSKDFDNKMPSFYCTYCDYDVCQICLGKYKLNEVKLDLTEQIKKSKNIKNFLKANEQYVWNKKSPDHNHALVLVGRINSVTTWVCNDCKKNFRNIDPSYYCSLCDYDICINCLKAKEKKK